MSLGHLTLINCVLKMGGEVNSKMHNQLTAMHCAAQTYHGLLSILVLAKRYDVRVNVTDAKCATPLHFACMYRENKNVEMFVALKADLDA